MNMLFDWENKFRKHWPHHYRDILDKIESPLSMVVVSDIENKEYSDKSLAILQKSSKGQIEYEIILEDSQKNKITKKYNKDELDFAILKFLEIIAGWEAKAE